MTRRGWILAGLLAAAITGALVAYDALVVSDEERLEQLVDDATGTLDLARIERGRARWVDVSRQPLEISVFGEPRAYREGDEQALHARAVQAARRLAGSRLRNLGSRIEVDGDRASVTIRAFVEGYGMGRLELTLRKHGDDWLVERLRVQR